MRPLPRLLLWHLIFCIFYYLARPLLQDRSYEAVQAVLNPSAILFSLISFAIFFGYAYFPFEALRRFYDRPWYVLVAGLFGASVVAIAIRYGIEEVIAPATVGFRNYAPGTSLLTYYLDNLYYLILHGLVGVTVFLVDLAARRERDRQQLALENQRTELAFLRGQINPHFLFNTLNNVYSLVFTGDERAPQILERLTGLLRYALYERDTLVPLRREVDYLLNLIELERLRLEQPLELDLQLPDSTELEHRLPPLLLITFLENVFKHGDPTQPITVSLSVVDKHLFYKVTNTLAPARQKDGTGGIGLAGLRRRLGLLFPDNHSLDTRQEGDQYISTLKLPLK